MADDGGDRQIGARGYAVHYGIALPDYDKPLEPDEEFLDEMKERGPWTLTEWDGAQWVHVAKVKDRAELDRWLAGEPRER